MSLKFKQLLNRWYWNAVFPPFVFGKTSFIIIAKASIPPFWSILLAKKWYCCLPSCQYFVIPLFIIFFFSPLFPPLGVSQMMSEWDTPWMKVLPLCLSLNVLRLSLSLLYWCFVLHKTQSNSSTIRIIFLSILALPLEERNTGILSPFVPGATKSRPSNAQEKQASFLFCCVFPDTRAAVLYFFSILTKESIS